MTNENDGVHNYI